MSSLFGVALITDPFSRQLHTEDIASGAGRRAIEDGVSNHLMSKVIGVGLAMANVICLGAESESPTDQLGSLKKCLHDYSDYHEVHQGSSFHSSDRRDHLIWSSIELFIVSKRQGRD